MEIEPFGKQLRRVRDARGLSRSALSRKTVTVGDEGVAEVTIEALETKPQRWPEDRTIVLLGRALEADIDEFPAYGLAEVRRLLNEREVGQDAALATLRVLSEVLAETADLPALHAAEPGPHSGHLSDASQSADAPSSPASRRGAA